MNLKQAIFALLAVSFIAAGSVNAQSLAAPVSAVVNLEPLALDEESSDPLAAFSEDAAMNYSISIVVESLLDVHAVHIELGTGYGSDDILSFEALLDGSDMPEGLVLTVVDDVLFVELGEHPNHSDDIHGHVYFLDANGQASTALAFAQ